MADFKVVPTENSYKLTDDKTGETVTDETFGKTTPVLVLAGYHSVMRTMQDKVRGFHIALYNLHQTTDIFSHLDNIYVEIEDGEYMFAVDGLHVKRVGWVEEPTQ